MEKFWMIWRDDGPAPVKQHVSLRSAEVEAERLAKANLGARFVVLESVKFATVEDPVRWHETRSAPF